MVSKEAKLITESKMIVTGGKGSRIGWMLFKGTNLQPIVNKSQGSNHSIVNIDNKMAL